MAPLFQRADGSPMHFYLTNLTEELLRNVINLIQSNGGKVEKTINEDEYLTFTTPSECYTYRFVFDVLFIQHCVEYDTLLGIDQYYIGDSRLKTQKDRMFRLLIGNRTVVKMENLSSNETLSDITNLPKPSTSICPKEALIVLTRLEHSFLNNPLSSAKETETHWIKTELVKSELEIEETFCKPSSPQSSFSSRSSDEEYLPNANGSSDTEPQVSDVDMKEEYLDPEASTSTVIKSLKQSTISERRIIESSDSELEISDVDNREEYSDALPWISTKNQNSENESSSNEDLVAKPRTSRVNCYSNKFSTVPTKELIQWAQEVTKDLKKDEFGHPEGNSHAYEKWEKDMIIAFIVRVGRFDLGKGSRLWQLAYNLKIFPRRRTYNSLMYEYSTHILSNIKDFELPPDIEANFIKAKQLNFKVKEASEDLKAWAKEVTAQKKKDEFGYPIATSQAYTWEKKMMIDFLIKSGKIKQARSYSTWELACTLKIFPRCRIARNLQKVFPANVLTEIEKYNLPKWIEAQFLNLKSATTQVTLEPSEDLKEWAAKMRMPATNKKRGESFQDWKKTVMLEYLIKADQIENYRSPQTWKCFKELKLFPDKSTCTSLIQKFRHKILPTIEQFNLPEDILKRFTKIKKSRCYKDIEIPEEVKIWAAQVSKDRKKDEFGYPIQFGLKMQYWEKVLMVDFVRKVGRFDLAKAPNFWNLTTELKFLPRKRSIFTLAAIYRYKILPYIEDFNLPPDDKAAFIKSRTEADVKNCSRMGKNRGRCNKPNQLNISIS